MAKGSGEKDLTEQGRNTGQRMRSAAAALMEPGFSSMAPKTNAKVRKTEPAAWQANNAKQSQMNGSPSAMPQPFAKGGKVARLADGGQPPSAMMGVGNLRPSAAPQGGLPAAYVDPTQGKMPAAGTSSMMAAPSRGAVFADGSTPQMPAAYVNPMTSKMPAAGTSAMVAPSTMKPTAAPARDPAQQANDPWADFEAKMAAMGNQAAGPTDNESRMEAKRGGKVGFAKGGSVGKCMKCGGAAHKGMCSGGKMAVGGKVHGDEAQDKKLFKKMFKQEESTESKGMKKGGKKEFNPGGTPGKLHREMGIPVGQKIPAGKLAAAANSPDKEKRNDAIRAQTMKGWKHADGGRIDNLEADETGPKTKIVPGAAGAGQGVPRSKISKYAVGGVAKIRHDEMTKDQKQTPDKPSGWNAYK